MRMTEAVTAAVGESTEPAAVLALTYAQRIDEATHVRLAIDKALATLGAICQTTDQADALAKVGAELSAVTVLSDLGPKLLATLDALTLTPKARAAIDRKLGDAGQPANPLDALRDRHDSRRLRAAS